MITVAETNKNLQYFLEQIGVAKTNLYLPLSCTILFCLFVFFLLLFSVYLFFNLILSVAQIALFYSVHWEHNLFHLGSIERNVSFSKFRSCFN